MTDQPTIDEYCRICVLQDRRELPLATAFLRREELIEKLVTLVAETLTKFGGADCTDHLRIAAQLFDDLLGGGVFDFADDQLAGEYFSYMPPRYQQFRSNSLSGSVIFSRARAIGARYFPDAFAGYSQEGENPSPTGILKDTRVPAADRLVSLNHNSADYVYVRDEIEVLTSRISKDNEIGETANDRDRIVRSLEAAQVLWKATELQIIQIKVGIILAIEEAGKALRRLGRSVTTSLLVDAIKAFIKSISGIDM